MVLINKSRVKMLIASQIGRLLNVDAEIRDIRFGLINNITLVDLRVKRDSEAVSYTHLTLPTSDLV